jgi:membrane protease subunit HflK
MDGFQEIKINKPKLPQFSKKKVTTILIIAAIVIFILTGLYTVNPEEVGVIQRFGKYSRTTMPGLNFKIPFGVEVLTKVPVREVFKEEFGFRTLQAGVKTQYSTRDYSNEALMLTGDLNIASIEWILQYRIKDAVNYLFNVRNVQETIRDLSESTMRLIVGDRSFDESIVLGRQIVAYEAQQLLQEALDKYGAGIEIMTINLKNTTPPDKVKPAFNEVNSSKQVREKIINEAWQEYNRIIPEAEGKAKRTIEEAQGYALNRVNRATGDATRFLDMYNQYRYAKEITKKRLYLETMEKVLPKIEQIYIVDEKQTGILPLLNLDKGAKK